MKFNSIKKLLALTLCIPMILSGCNQPANNAQEQKHLKISQLKHSEFKIGITQIVQHPALDASRQGFIDELKKFRIKCSV